MHGGAAEDMELAEDTEELSVSRTRRANIAVSLSLSLVCLGVLALLGSSVLDPGLAACCAGVAGAAAFGWDAYISGEIEQMLLLPEMPTGSFDLLESAGDN